MGYSRDELEYMAIGFFATLPLGRPDLGELDSQLAAALADARAERIALKAEYERFLGRLVDATGIDLEVIPEPRAEALIRIIQLGMAECHSRLESARNAVQVHREAAEAERCATLRAEAQRDELLAVLEPLLIEVEPLRYEQREAIEEACRAKAEWAKHANATRRQGSEPWAFMTEFRRALESATKPLTNAVRDANLAFDRITSEVGAKPDQCEHGILTGEFCETCNAEHKQAARENGDLEEPLPPITPEDLSLVLEMVDKDASPELIATWTEEQRAEAHRWAALEHLAASDNDVERIPEPEHVKVLRSPPRFW